MARVGRNIKGVFISTGNPDTVNDPAVSVTTIGSAQDLSGQLGALLQTADGGREYIYAQVSATGTGLTPAATQPMYWINRQSTGTMSQWVVDNNTSAGNGTVANLAGILRVAATRGNNVFLLRKGSGIPVNSTSTGFVLGDIVIPSTTSGAASFIASTSTIVAVAGAFIKVLGIVSSTATSGVAITTDVDIF